MSPYTVKWGIISTGGIATAFAKDLLVDPSTRDASDVAHEIAAVGSRSTDSAQKFIDKLKAFGDDSEHPSSWGVKKGLLAGTKAYGTYDEVFADKNVTAVYIGTPHTFHYQPAKDAMKAGKHVLCEKPVTYDMAELDDLLRIAKENNVFFMEAVWTRFQPISYEVQEWIHSGKLGKVKHLTANNLVDFDPENKDPSHRMVDPKLGGGSILDLGPYPSVWTMLILHHHPDNKGRTAPKFVSSKQDVFSGTGVDAESTWTVEWDNVAAAVLTSSMVRTSDKPAITVECEKGTFFVESPPWRPLKYTVEPKGDVEGVTGKKTFTAKQHPGGAMHYEADEVARCVRDGKSQSERMSWDDSRIVQQWFDEVRQRGDTVLKDVKGLVSQ